MTDARVVPRILSCGTSPVTIVLACLVLCWSSTAGAAIVALSGDVVTVTSATLGVSSMTEADRLQVDASCIVITDVTIRGVLSLTVRRDRAAAPCLEASITMRNVRLPSPSVRHVVTAPAGSVEMDRVNATTTSTIFSTVDILGFSNLSLRNSEFGGLGLDSFNVTNPSSLKPSMSGNAILIAFSRLRGQLRLQRGNVFHAVVRLHHCTVGEPPADSISPRMLLDTLTFRESLLAFTRTSVIGYQFSFKQSTVAFRNASFLGASAFVLHRSSVDMIQRFSILDGVISMDADTVPPRLMLASRSRVSTERWEADGLPFNILRSVPGSAFLVSRSRIAGGFLATNGSAVAVVDSTVEASIRVDGATVACGPECVWAAAVAYRAEAVARVADAELESGVNTGLAFLQDIFSNSTTVDLEQQQVSLTPLTLRNVTVAAGPQTRLWLTSHCATPRCETRLEGVYLPPVQGRSFTGILNWVDSSWTNGSSAVFQQVELTLLHAANGNSAMQFDGSVFDGAALTVSRCNLTIISRPGVTYGLLNFLPTVSMRYSVLRLIDTAFTRDDPTSAPVAVYGAPTAPWLETHLLLEDSIIAGSIDVPATRLTMENCTVFGHVSITNVDGGDGEVGTMFAAGSYEASRTGSLRDVVVVSASTIWGITSLRTSLPPSSRTPAVGGRIVIRESAFPDHPYLRVLGNEGKLVFANLAMADGVILLHNVTAGISHRAQRNRVVRFDGCELHRVLISIDGLYGSIDGGFADPGAAVVATNEANVLSNSTVVLRRSNMSTTGNGLGLSITAVNGSLLVVEQCWVLGHVFADVAALNVDRSTFRMTTEVRSLRGVDNAPAYSPAKSAAAAMLVTDSVLLRVVTVTGCSISGGDGIVLHRTQLPIDLVGAFKARFEVSSCTFERSAIVLRHCEVVVQHNSAMNCGVAIKQTLFVNSHFWAINSSVTMVGVGGANENALASVDTAWVRSAMIFVNSSVIADAARYGMNIQQPTAARVQSALGLLTAAERADVAASDSSGFHAVAFGSTIVGGLLTLDGTLTLENSTVGDLTVTGIRLPASPLPNVKLVTDTVVVSNLEIAVALTIEDVVLATPDAGLALRNIQRGASEPGVTFRGNVQLENIVALSGGGFVHVERSSIGIFHRNSGSGIMFLRALTVANGSSTSSAQDDRFAASVVGVAFTYNGTLGPNEMALKLECPSGAVCLIANSTFWCTRAGLMSGVRDVSTLATGFGRLCIADTKFRVGPNVMSVRSLNDVDRIDMFHVTSDVEAGVQEWGSGAFRALASFHRSQSCVADERFRGTRRGPAALDAYDRSQRDGLLASMEEHITNVTSVLSSAANMSAQLREKHVCILHATRDPTQRSCGWARWSVGDCGYVKTRCEEGQEGLVAPSASAAPSFTESASTAVPLRDAATRTTRSQPIRRGPSRTARHDAPVPQSSRTATLSYGARNIDGRPSVSRDAESAPPFTSRRSATPTVMARPHAGEPSFVKPGSVHVVSTPPAAVGAAAAAATVAVAAAEALSLRGIGPGAVARASRLASIGRLASCVVDESSTAALVAVPSPSYVEIPIRFKLWIGSQELRGAEGLADNNGGVLCSVLIAVASAACAAGMFATRIKLPRRSWRQAFAATAGCILPCYCCPGVWSEGMPVLVAAFRAGEHGLVAFQLSMSFVAVAASAPLVWAGLMAPRYALPRAAALHSSSTTEPAQSASQPTLENTRPDVPFAELYAIVVDATRAYPGTAAARLHVACEVVTALCLSVASSLPVSTVDGCMWRSWAGAGVCAVYLAYLAAVRPYASRLDTGFVAVAGGAQLVAALCLAAAFSSSSPVLGTAAGWCVVLQTALLLGQPVAALAVEAHRAWTTRRTNVANASDDALLHVPLHGACSPHEDVASSKDRGSAATDESNDDPKLRAVRNPLCVEPVGDLITSGTAEL